MKNIKLRAVIIVLLAFICVFSVVKAYEVKYGDTLSGIAKNANLSLAQVIDLNPQINDPNLIYAGQIINTNSEDSSLFLEEISVNNTLQYVNGVPQITYSPVALTLGATTPFRPSEFKTTLATSLTEGHAGTTLKVNSITTKDGNSLDGSVLGDVIVLHINPGKTNAEIVKCTGLTTATKTFTGCTFGYRFDTNSTQSANIKAHSQGETVIISDDDLYLTTQYPTIVGANTFTGANYFASSTSETVKMYLTTSTQVYLWANKATGQFGYATNSTEYVFNVNGTTFNPNVPLNLTSGELKLATSTNDFILDTGALSIRKNNSITANDGGLAVATTSNFVWTGNHTFSTGILTMADATVTDDLIIGSSSWAAPTNTLTVIGDAYITGSLGFDMLTASTTAIGTTTASTTASDSGDFTSNTTVDIGFKPNYIKIYYILGGQTGASYTETYSGLLSVNQSLKDVGSMTFARYVGETGFSGIATTTTFDFTGTATPAVGTDGAGDDCKIVLSIPEINNDGFVIRRVITHGGGGGGSCYSELRYEAFR